MILASLRDTLLIARFEVLRAIRSWRAVAMIAAYLVANVGGAWIFIEALGALESSLAEGMGVATTRWPGAMMEQLRQSKQIQEMLTFLTGDEEVAKGLNHVPLLAVYQLWQGFLLVPFLAATAASECLAIDVASRAIRFEVMRTGRAELVVGRFLGQMLLTSVALGLALLAVLGLGLGLMYQQDPVELGLALLGFGGRSLLFAVPFVGLGASCSAITASPAWARVMALAGTAGSWVAFGLCEAAASPWAEQLADVVMPLLPQTAISGLWRSDGSLALSAATLLALGVGALLPGLLRFSGRDL